MCAHVCACASDLPAMPTSPVQQQRQPKGIIHADRLLSGRLQDWPQAAAAARRYAITLSVPKGAVRKGIYFDTANPHHSVRLVEGGDGRNDLLLVSGEEHDQGIKPDEYADYFGRYLSAVIALCVITAC